MTIVERHQYLPPQRHMDGRWHGTNDQGRKEKERALTWSQSQTVLTSWAAWVT